MHLSYFKVSHFPLCTAPQYFPVGFAHLSNPTLTPGYIQFKPNECTTFRIRNGRYVRRKQTCPSPPNDYTYESRKISFTSPLPCKHNQAYKSHGNAVIIKKKKLKVSVGRRILHSYILDRYYSNVGVKYLQRHSLYQ